MLDQLDVALRRYEQIRPQPGEPVPARTAPELSLWLEHDVCAVTQDLVGRPDFQAESRWPIEHLAVKMATAERAMVEAVDADLVGCAQRLATFARLPAIRAALLRLGPDNELLLTGDPKGSDPGARHAEGTPLGLPAIEYIARRPWRDLVCVQDYFYPANELNRALNLADREPFRGPSGGQLTLAAFAPIFNPRLRSVGDFVARTLLVRVEYWQRVLQRFMVRCQIALQYSGQKLGSHWEDLSEAHRQLHEHFENLQDSCLAGRPAEIRNACMALVQVYADYRPRANLDWLGLPPWVRTSRWIRHRVESQHDFSIGEQLAAALINVSGMFRKDVDLDAVVKAKCQSCALVIVTGPGRRDVYWKGHLLKVDWVSHNGSWDLLAALVERVKSAQGADAVDLKLAIKGSLKDRRHRLKQLLPADLDEEIQPAGRGTYRLALQPEKVCLLRFEDDERLTEVDDVLAMSR
jgi:hypothetical protein